MYEWFRIFDAVHCQTGMGGFIRVEWPEPGGYADQPAIVPVAFGLVEEAKIEEFNANSGK